jgi:hypothetical protein
MAFGANSVPYFCLKEDKMRRGWEVEYTDGKIINESQMDWRSLPKLNMARLSLLYDGRRWDLHNKVAYAQKKRGSAIPGQQGSFQIESRSVGYYDVVDDGNVKIWYTVNEFTGKMTMEVENL